MVLFVTLIFVGLIKSKYSLIRLAFYFLLLKMHFFCSYFFHELGHAIFLTYKNKRFIIEKNLFFLSIISKDDMCKKYAILGALVGPIILILISLILLFCKINFNIIVFLIYFIHIIYLLPIFGDGKIIMDSILKN